MREIFISYRRDDSAGYAGRIFDYLKAVFGQDRVFLDVDDIQPGQVFADVIQERIAGCAVVIVVIGKRWLENLRSRAGGETDYVSAEILAALKSSAVVIPVLVGGASMPKPVDLPGPLAGLAGREALEIHDTTFAEDVACLVNAIKKVPGFEWQPPAELSRHLDRPYGAARIRVPHAPRISKSSATIFMARSSTRPEKAQFRTPN